MIDAEGTRDVLRGYGEANPAPLEALMEVQDWKRIEHRATQVIQLLDVPSLETFTSGSMDMRTVCKCSLDENKQGLP